MKWKKPHLNKPTRLILSILVMIGLMYPLFSAATKPAEPNGQKTLSTHEVVDRRRIGVTQEARAIPETADLDTVWVTEAQAPLYATALEVIFPETLIRGEDFVLEAYLYQPEGTLLHQTGRIPLADQPVTFSIEVTFDNGTAQNITDIISTNVQGIARFILSSDATKDIKLVSGIEVSYPGSSTYQPIHFIVDSVNLPIVRSSTETQSVQTPGIDLSITIIGLGFGALILALMRETRKSM